MKLLPWPASRASGARLVHFTVKATCRSTSRPRSPGAILFSVSVVCEVIGSRRAGRAGAMDVTA